MRDIIAPDLEKYVNDLVPPRDPVLAQMEEQARARGIPIVGPAVGSFLALLVKLSGARRIFELGSAIGYSTIWLARAAGPGAEVHYSDGDARNAAEAKSYFERAGLLSSITIHVGDALKSLAATTGPFDFIFNDVDKEGYPAVLEAVPARLRAGGLFVTDNALWHGTVGEPEDEAGRAVVRFTRNLYDRKDFITALLPLRDGVLVSAKVRAE